jgi:hypothetical protein
LFDIENNWNIIDENALASGVVNLKRNRLKESTSMVEMLRSLFKYFVGPINICCSWIRRCSNIAMMLDLVENRETVATFDKEDPWKYNPQIFFEV